MGLTPKKTQSKSLLTWSDLDDQLKQFIDNSQIQSPSTIVNPDNFVMTKDEIISELKANGYSYKESGTILYVS